MYTRKLLIALALALVFALAIAGCAADDGVPADVGSETPGEATDGGDAAGGTQLAFGLYDLEDGTVQAVGRLEWVDLEGGFWALVGGDDGAAAIAVIQNADEFLDTIEALEGRDVIVTGTRFDGASIRMAGPEIIIDSIDEIAAAGAAE
jgi:hypothetical protein